MRDLPYDRLYVLYHGLAGFELALLVGSAGLSSIRSRVALSIIYFFLFSILGIGG
jgi:hypothetical protein